MPVRSIQAARWLAFTVVAFSAVNAAFSAPDPPETAKPVAIAVDPARPSTLYASFPGFGVFKSDDHGDSWLGINEGLGTDRVSLLLIHPEAPQTIFAFDEETGLYVSLDGGESWNLAGPGLPPMAQVFEVKLDPRDPAVLWAATDSGIFRSPNRGEVWRMTPFYPAGSLRIAIAPDASTVFAVTTRGTVFVSEDAGRKWRPVGVIPLDGHVDVSRRWVRQLLIDPNRPERLIAATAVGLFMSWDRGVTWERVIEGPIDHVVLDPLTPSSLYALGQQGLLTSTDGGLSWTLLSGARGSALAIDPRAPDTLYVAGTDIRVFRSHDRGGSWRLVLHERLPPAHLEPFAQHRSRAPKFTVNLQVGRGVGNLDRGFHNDNHVAAIVADPSNPNVIYAGSLRGVFTSIDFGETWHFVSRGLAVTDVHALAVDPDTPSTIYAGTHGGGLHRSLDAGRNWHVTGAGIDDLVIRDVIVDPLEPSVIYVATGRGGVFMSSDYGVRFTRLRPAVAAGDELADVRALALDPDFPFRVAAAAAQQRPWVWDASLSAWSHRLGKVGFRGGDFRVHGYWHDYSVRPARLEVRELAFDPASPNTVFAATALGLFRSANGGGSWGRPQLKANVTSIAVDPLDSRILWAGTAKGLSRSGDSGRSWQSVDVGDPEAAVLSLAIDPRGSVLGLRRSRQRDRGRRQRFRPSVRPGSFAANAWPAGDPAKSVGRSFGDAAGGRTARS